MPDSSLPRPLQNTSDAADARIAEAIRACAAGGVAGLQRLYELTAPRLLGQLVQMLGDRATAEEALEECFIKIWKRAASFSAQRCGAYAWLLSVVRHHAIDLLRERGSAPAVEGASLLVAQAPPGTAGAMTDEQWQCLHLAYVGGQSRAQITVVLGRPLSAVKEAIHMGLMTLATRASP
jgi:RNA polymerase sigma-70 factor, ECF subfamily